ncbi:MAG TPA: hypothetical protein VLT61_09520 [Anaeromyxobacteraceae bacterium]|nr:hypothetical protein [Anaeromyxobacteraceae bacterium]
MAAAGLLLAFHGPELVLGNLHDRFMPYLSAHAAEAGMPLHVAFRTPFGWVYAALNLASLRLSEAGVLGLRYGDLAFVTSVLFSVAIAVAFAHARLALPRGHTIPLWVLPLALSLALTMRDVSRFDYVSIFWYGGYNNHLWALLLVQAAVLFRTRRALRVGPDTIGAGRGVALAVLHASIAFVALHYKANFGLAAMALTAGWLLSLPPARWPAALAAGGATLAAGILAVWRSGYSYAGYFADLATAAQAKTLHAGAVDQTGPVLGAAAMLLLLRASHALAAAGAAGPPPGLPVSAALHDLRRWAIAWAYSGGWRAAAGDAAIAAALFVGLGGDFAQPLVLLAVFAALHALLERDAAPAPRPAAAWRALRVAAGATLAVFFALDVLAIARVAWFRERTLDPKRYQVVVVDPGDPARTLPFVLRRPAGRYADWYQVTGLGDHPRRAQLLLERACTVTGVFDGDSNVSFIDFVAETIAALRRLGADRSTRVLSLEFSNPFPPLLRASVPRGSFNWIHPGTNIAIDDLGSLDPAIADADVAVVPFRTVDALWQPAVNCHFFAWNSRNGWRFAPVAIGAYGIVLADRSFLADRGAAPVADLASLQAGLAARCAESWPIAVRASGVRDRVIPPPAWGAPRPAGPEGPR